MTVLVLFLLALRSTVGLEHGIPLTGEEAEQFLRTATVVEMRPLKVGITGPKQALLSDGKRSLRAAWKTVDQHRRGFTELEDGRKEFNFTDSYKYEIAAYELDKLLGLGLVPPAVERKIEGEPGALVLWVEGTITEAERKKRGRQTPDPEAWNAQMYKVRLLHQLTYNTDYHNNLNVLSDPDFRIYAIDHSRAFRTQRQLLAEKHLERFSRPVLEKLRALDRSLLQAKLDAWLTSQQVEALWARRQRILDLADQLVAERGEARVLYP
jgi:hypothetical protein